MKWHLLRMRVEYYLELYCYCFEALGFGFLEFFMSLLQFSFFISFVVFLNPPVSVPVF